MTILGRKIGWTLSRSVFYRSRAVVCVIFCVIWGVVNAQGLNALIQARHPGLLLKIYGYGAGAYIATPNYRFFDARTIPEGARNRHYLIALLPVAVYAIASALFAFGVV